MPSSQCHTTTLPRPCAEKFEEISCSLASLDRIADDVGVLRRTVVGNGRAEGSLAFRVGRLEQDARATQSAAARWTDRAWRLCVAAGLIMFGWWLKS